ncbi:helix-turn-helix domain-containing protein [Azospirillum thermophilum]|uniref:XRE family transcriptional regulator n=1 Tax=Azospirillum thermophilum TaxID=2202148 RepID=A0A2S2CVN9_9PROT|nr:helix-turn-helix transcriptional regulator [Azospirillum thermophilum]AWK88572.1 XRE family transcriptional regulator [Azospirillum thermophilum]
MRAPHDPPGDPTGAAVTTRLPNLGARLRRLRRLRGIKQGVFAAVARVTQATVSRWERGEIEPGPEAVERLLAFLGDGAGCPPDGALRRLVESSLLPTHLIADHDHRLLAASTAREREWGRAASDLAGLPLWRFATGEIQAAEERLEGLGWWDEPSPGPVELATGRGDRGLRIEPGLMVWERLYLADGTPVRLCTTVPGVSA